MQGSILFFSTNMGRTFCLWANCLAERLKNMKPSSFQPAYKNQILWSYCACSCRLLLPLEFASGTNITGVLSVQEVDTRRVRVSMLRCSRDRASCFLERSCNMREWWSFILCSERLSEDGKGETRRDLRFKVISFLSQKKICLSSSILGCFWYLPLWHLINSISCV